MAIRLLTTLFDFVPGTIVRDISYDIEKRIVERGAASYDLTGGTEAAVPTFNPNLSETEKAVVAIEELLLTNRNTSTLEPFAKQQDFGQVAITYPDPAVVIAVTGTGDPELNPVDGGFVSVENAFESNLFFGDTFEFTTDGRIKVLRPGKFKISAYMDLTHSVNNATVGVTATIERATVLNLSGRSIHAKFLNAGQIANLVGIVAFDALADDIIGIAVASDLTGNITFTSSIICLEYMGS